MILFQGRQRPIAIQTCLLEAIQGAISVSQRGMNLGDRYERHLLSACPKLQAFEEIAGVVLVAGGGFDIGKFRQQAGLRCIVKQRRPAVISPGLAILAKSSQSPP